MLPEDSRMYLKSLPDFSSDKVSRSNVSAKIGTCLLSLWFPTVLYFAHMFLTWVDLARLVAIVERNKVDGFIWGCDRGE